jgi:hypothetical protein
MRNPLSKEVRQEKLRGYVLDIRRQTAADAGAIGRLARLYDRVLAVPPANVAAEEYYEYERRKAICIGGIAFSGAAPPLFVQLRRSTCYAPGIGARDDELSLFLNDDVHGRVRVRLYSRDQRWRSEGTIAPAGGHMGTQHPGLAALPGLTPIVNRVVDLAEMVCGPEYVRLPELPSGQNVQPPA